ncbi:MAG: hypothetical protein HQL56_08160 [Magnetococcales bacterium]|nr:hypothetical protein [Magnetococcales bacterium]
MAGRPPKQTPVTVTLDEAPGLPAAVEAHDVMVSADAMIIESQEVFQAVGRIEGLEFVKRVSDVAIAQTFDQIRKSKKYMGLPYRDSEGNVKRVSHLEEFCQAFLGRGYRRCVQLADTLYFLGSEMYEQAEQIGFKARDYTALKALPAQDQEIIKQAMATDSRDQVIDLLQEMASKHQQEKEAAARKEKEQAADLEAKDRVIEKRTKEKTELELKLAKATAIEPDAREAKRREDERHLRWELEHSTSALIHQVNTFSEAIANFRLHCQSGSAMDLCNNTASWAFKTIAEIASNHGLEIDFQAMVEPEWLRAAKEDGP